jgi:transposase
MSETNKRKFHTAEFKAKVDLEALRGAKTINEIGQEYGVHPVTVRQPERLYSEIGKLKMELDWLKKKSGFSLP